MTQVPFQHIWKGGPAVHEVHGIGTVLQYCERSRLAKVAFKGHSEEVPISELTTYVAPILAAEQAVQL